MGGWGRQAKGFRGVNVSVKIKILFVIDALQFGGGERVFSQLINGLSPKDYEVHLASHSNLDLYQAVEKANPSIHLLDFTKRVNVSIMLKLARVIRQNSIDIVHGQGARAEFHARIATRCAGNTKYISAIAMPVEGFDVNFLRRIIYRFFDRFTEKYVSKFIVVSDSLNAMMIERRGISPEKVVRIFNGIEIDQYSPSTDNRARRRIREQFSISEDSVLVGAIGRLVWQKGFEYLIEALPEILKSYPDSKLLIVGEGPLKKKLGAISKEIGVADRVIFTGFRADVKEILSAIDILVIPSLLEGFPMITLEAMAMAKPIVSTRIDGITEQLINRESGILVSPRDHGALAFAISELISDQNRAKDFGLNARNRVEKCFSVEKMISDTEKVYRSIAQNYPFQ